MMRALCLAVLALAGCEVVEANDVQFDKQLGAAYGVDPCTCSVDSGVLKFLCTSDGDTDIVNFRIPLTPAVDVAVEFTVAFEDGPLSFSGQATAHIDSIGEPVMIPEESSVVKFRHLEGVSVRWDPQDVTCSTVDCEGARPIHSAVLSEGHGGCDDLFGN